MIANTNEKQSGISLSFLPISCCVRFFIVNGDTALSEMYYYKEHILFYIFIEILLLSKKYAIINKFIMYALSL